MSGACVGWIYQVPWLLLMTSSGWRQQREYCYFWVIAKRLQKIDIKKMMNQLISVGGPDSGQEKAVGNSRGMEKWEKGWRPVRAQKGSGRNFDQYPMGLLGGGGREDA